MRPIKIRVPVKPVAASRPRVPRYGKPYFLKTYKKWRDDCERTVPEYRKKPLDMPVMLTVRFAIPRARTSQLVVPAGDGDNFEKGLYDMLVRKKYLLDDKWITSAVWLKRFLPFGLDGYCEVIIEEECDDVDLECSGPQGYPHLLRSGFILP